MSATSSEALGGGSAASGGARPISLYIHWPFCQSKCPYCDFNSHVRERIDEPDWAAALVQALDAQAEQLAGREIVSVFFGGGTPSLMAPATVGAALDRAAALAAFAAEPEITLEANPSSVEASRFQGYRAAGVNRLSLGVQALAAADLALLGRRHDAAEAERAVETAARWFQRYSFDLIYARPGQTVEAWLAELDRAMALACDHLSLYQLTIEPGTRFHALHARGDLVVPDEQAAGALYEATQVHLASRGLPAYEISNHARPGAESRHNRAYWRSEDWIGVGPGAHGRMWAKPGVRRGARQIKAPEAWRADLAAGGTGMAEIETVGQAQSLDEVLMMGLRLTEGVDLAAAEAKLGAPLTSLLDPRRLDDLVAEGLLDLTADRLTATAAGRQRLGALLAYLVG